MHNEGKGKVTEGSETRQVERGNATPKIGLRRRGFRSLSFWSVASAAKHETEKGGIYSEEAGEGEKKGEEGEWPSE